MLKVGAAYGERGLTTRKHGGGRDDKHIEDLAGIAFRVSWKNHLRRAFSKRTFGHKLMELVLIPSRRPRYA
jgi:hypothetical protein